MSPLQIACEYRSCTLFSDTAIRIPSRSTSAIVRSGDPAGARSTWPQSRVRRRKGDLVGPLRLGSQKCHIPGAGLGTVGQLAGPIMRNDFDRHIPIAGQARSPDQRLSLSGCRSPDPWPREALLPKLIPARSLPVGRGPSAQPAPPATSDATEASNTVPLQDERELEHGELQCGRLQVNDSTRQRALETRGHDLRGWKGRADWADGRERGNEKRARSRQRSGPWCAATSRFRRAPSCSRRSPRGPRLPSWWHIMLRNHAAT